MTRPLTGPAAPRAVRRDTLARALLTAYAVVALADLVALLAAADLGHTLLKPLLLPLLAAWAATRGGPPLLTAALLFGWGGDVLLLADRDPLFLAGMGSFALGHVCYLVLFQRYGFQRYGFPPYGPSRARTASLAGVYAVALVGTVALLWSDLPGDMRVPMAGYSLLLTAMAFRATRLGPAAAVGGALFLLSDTLIATGIADWPQLPRPDFWIMLTYLTAQALLARGVLAAADVPRARQHPAPAYGEET
ncbi:lysoplasmalogenase [Streptomyces sp. NPDC091292]|uniref:lysoplasmalogenase n=1 Tax=Streptomyces sp. NPDC091292 TaxID=3365991 RepID=UPI00381B6ED3